MRMAVVWMVWQLPGGWKLRVLSMRQPGRASVGHQLKAAQLRWPTQAAAQALALGCSSRFSTVPRTAAPGTAMYRRLLSGSCTTPPPSEARSTDHCTLPWVLNSCGEAGSGEMGGEAGDCSASARPAGSGGGAWRVCELGGMGG